MNWLRCGKFDKNAAAHLSGNTDDRLVYVPKLTDADVDEVVRLRFGNCM